MREQDIHSEYDRGDQFEFIDNDDLEFYDQSTLASRLSIAANRILFARAYTYFYVFMMILNLFLFAWGLSNHRTLESLNDEDSWYVALDIICSTVLALEIGVRICATHRTYFHQWLNLVDCVVLLLCVFSLFLYVADPETAIIGSAFILVRYIAQLVRIGIVFKYFRKHQRARNTIEDRVDFSRLGQVPSFSLNSVVDGAPLSGLSDIPHGTSGVSSELKDVDQPALR
eukprot:143531_1